jgi:hypothetical protein
MGCDNTVNKLASISIDLSGIIRGDHIVMGNVDIYRCYDIRAYHLNYKRRLNEMVDNINVADNCRSKNKYHLLLSRPWPVRLFKRFHTSVSNFFSKWHCSISRQRGGLLTVVRIIISFVLVLLVLGTASCYSTTGTSDQPILVHLDGISQATLDAIKGDPGPTGPSGADGYSPIKGVDYFDGTNGSSGSPGSIWSSGTSSPSGGNDGDMYYKTDTYHVYEKITGTWTDLGSIRGAAGANGDKGDTGSPGSIWSSGTSSPSGGNDGDMYYKTDTYHVYEKITGTWTDLGSIRGAAGTNGDKGDTGDNGQGFSWRGNIALPNVDLTSPSMTITASSSGNGGEEYYRAYDNNYTSSKWCTYFDNPSWLKFDFITSVVIDEMTITSGNDASGRDPKTWTLSGSNNDSNWTTIGTTTNETFNSRLLKKTYNYTNSTAYRYYKWNVTANNGDSPFQIEEIELMVSSVSATYEPYDIVLYNGHDYICTNEIINPTTAPDIDTSHWSLFL